MFTDVLGSFEPSFILSAIVLVVLWDLDSRRTTSAMRGLWPNFRGGIRRTTLLSCFVVLNPNSAAFLLTSAYRSSASSSGTPKIQKLSRCLYLLRQSASLNWESFVSFLFTSGSTTFSLELIRIFVKTSKNEASKIHESETNYPL